MAEKRPVFVEVYASKLSLKMNANLSLLEEGW